MRIRNETPFMQGWLAGRVPPAPFTVSCILKGTFDLVPGGAMTPSRQQVPLTGELREGDNDDGPVVLPTDFAHFKPGAEVLVKGRAHAPEGRREPVLRVGVSVGDWSKRLAVFGWRYWKIGVFGSVMTEPEPIANAELSWRYALGGPGYAPNPFGMGLVPDPAKVAETDALPLIENPDDFIQAPSSRPRPAGFGPLPNLEAVKRGLGGTYDAEWVKKHWPFFPPDFDWRYFFNAPEDQQLDHFLRGDEPVVLTAMHPRHQRLETRLPGLRPRWIIRRDDDSLTDVPMRLDTLILEPEAMRAMITWRGVAPVRGVRLPDVRSFWITQEPLEVPPVEAAALALRFELAETVAVLPPQAELASGPRPPLARVADEVEQSLQRVKRDLTAQAAELRAGISEAPGAKAFAPAILALAAAVESAVTSPGLPEITRESVARMARERRSMARLKLAGLDLSGLDLSDADLEQTDLSGCNLERTVLARANLAHADFSGARLSRAELFHVGAADANFTRADLTAAILSHSDFTNAMFAGATLRGADLTACELARAACPRADLSGAKARHLNAAGAELGEANFSEASLEGADFTRARLGGANFERANLSAANLEGALCQGANFEKATAPKLHAGLKTVLAGARLVGANLSQANLEGARADGANFAGANLTGANLKHAGLQGAVFAAVLARGARFAEANLSRAELITADLMGADFESAILEHADFRGANLFRAELLDARMDNARFELADTKGTRLGL